MTERTTTLAAGTVAIALVVGVSTLRLRQREPSLAPKLLTQKVVLAENGSPMVQLTLLPPREEDRPKPEPDEDPIPLEFRLMDRHGRLYGSAYSNNSKPFSFNVGRTYGRTVEQPRVVAFYDGQPRGFIDLPPFPPPALRSLNPKPDSRIRASLERRLYLPGTPGGGPCLVFRPLTRLPKDECWDIRVLETNILFEGKTDGTAYRLNPDTAECLFAPPYAQDVDALRIHVVRRRRKVAREDVVIRGLRLRERNGQQTFDLPRPIPVPNRLGVTLRVSGFARPKSPKSPWPSYETYSPILTLDTRRTIDVQGYAVEAEIPWNSQPNVKPILMAGLLSPMPRELGLDAIEPLIWSVSPKATANRRPVVKGPFDLRVRLSKVTWETLGTFEATIPVER